MPDQQGAFECDQPGHPQDYWQRRHIETMNTQQAERTG